MPFSFERLDSGDLRVTVGNDFVPEDAWRIHELFERTDSGTRVEVDFRRVRDCHDFALSLLARDILSGRVTIELQGMTQHQERVLSYFGVTPVGAPGAAADFDPI
jgi:hypothetical protein